MSAGLPAAYACEPSSPSTLGCWYAALRGRKPPEKASARPPLDDVSVECGDEDLRAALGLDGWLGDAPPRKPLRSFEAIFESEENLRCPASRSRAATLLDGCVGAFRSDPDGGFPSAAARVERVNELLRAVVDALAVAVGGCCCSPGGLARREWGREPAGDVRELPAPELVTEERLSVTCSRDRMYRRPQK